VTTVDTPPVPTPAPAPQPPPVQPGSFFGAEWPGADGGAHKVTLAAVAIAGVTAAASLPLDRQGVGWLATGLAVFLGLLMVALIEGRPRISVSGVLRVAWGVAALALLAVGTLRAADWLFALSLPAAGVAGAIAIVGGRSVQGIVGSVLIQPIAVLRALPWGFKGVADLRGGRDRRNSARVGLTVLVTVALLLVFGMLFASADVGFARLTESVIPDGPTVFRWVFLFGAVGALTLGGAYLVLGPPRVDESEPGERRTVHRLEWTLPVAALDALFVAFVLVQLTVLFGGSEYVLRTSGLTYAEYARRGFWQLLVIMVLTLAVLGAAAHWAPRRTLVDRVLIRVLLGLLAALTLVTIVSALYRMQVYEEAYGFTQLRVFVMTVELALGVVYLLVVAAGIRLRGSWLPQAVVATGVVALLGLAAIDPDRFIAEQNIIRYERTGQIDTSYLADLSPDAIPALVRLSGTSSGRCVLEEVASGLAEPDDWKEWNYGRWRARQVLATTQLTFNCRG